jgi:hypothetical protein
MSDDDEKTIGRILEDLFHLHPKDWEDKLLTWITQLSVILGLLACIIAVFGAGSYLIGLFYHFVLFRFM